MKRKNRKKLRIVNKRKFIKSLLTLALAIVYIYVMIKRGQEVTGLSWFFTTWH